MFLVFAIHVKLPNALHRELLPLKFDLVRIWSKFASKVADMIGECCGKQDDLNA